VTQPLAQERPIGELFADLARETGMLVRQEVQLVKTEMAQKASSAGRNAALVVAGGAIGAAGLLALLAAIILGLQAFLPLWLSALVVGLATLAVGYLLIQKGLSSLKNLANGRKASYHEA